jgi:SHS2 domain-containing protein|tara:strand:+ start:6958 stop:7428 length:471 start_codon:yes stop_codon:yes gene_type:complete
MVQIHPPLPFLLRKRFNPKLRKIFEHTADAGIEVEDKNLSEAFQEVSLAFTEIITGGNLPTSKSFHIVDIEGIDLDNLLIRYISYLIFLFDTENFIVGSTNLEISMNKNKRLEGKIYGEIYDEKKHGYGVEIKAISYHMLHVSEGPPSKIKLILDL